ncbi:uncharacterized protein LOC133196883 [Saccostrea echinata]|uniref:uncharacterized protein LOC133196883 n=1 Tax=Saccostrea echinata TaxID=191078 RepID=UPI002A838AC4|nr:uncharacterized protein LOC133196883 [Saccostrea echinata]
MQGQVTGLYVLLYVIGGSLLSVRSALLPGSTPSSPNPTLRKCMTRAGYYNITDTPISFNNPFAKALHKWCSVYKDVVLCAEKSTKTNVLASPADWFFSMIFNSSIANETSNIMCQKLNKFGKKLSCMRRVQETRALRCVDALTRPIKKAMMKIYNGNITSMASLAQKGSCLISVATATCFREKVNSCRSYLRDYIGAYNLILGGKCLAILRSQDRNQRKTNGTVIKQSPEQEWMSTIQSLLNENDRISLYPDINRDNKHATAEIKSNPEITSKKPVEQTMTSVSSKLYIPPTSLQSTRSPSAMLEKNESLWTSLNVSEKDTSVRNSSEQTPKNVQQNFESEDDRDTYTEIDATTGKTITDDDELISDDRSGGGSVVFLSYNTLYLVIMACRLCRFLIVIF